MCSEFVEFLGIQGYERQATDEQSWPCQWWHTNIQSLQEDLLQTSRESGRVDYNYPQFVAIHPLECNSWIK